MHRPGRKDPHPGQHKTLTGCLLMANELTVHEQLEKRSMKFYGREQETAILRSNQDAVRNGASRCVVVTGRRRAGKTRLILERLPAADMPLIYVVTYQRTSERRNVELFCKAIAEGLKLDAVPRWESFEDALLFLFKNSVHCPGSNKPHPRKGKMLMIY